MHVCFHVRACMCVLVLVVVTGGGTGGAGEGAVPAPSKALVLAADEGPDVLVDTTKQVIGVPGFWLQAMRNNQVR
jgi:hypothetical protein